MIGRVKTYWRTGIIDDVNERLLKPSKYCEDTIRPLTIFDGIRYLILNNAYILCDGELCLASSLRVDYCNQQIYFPYLNTKYLYTAESKETFGYKYLNRGLGYGMIACKENIMNTEIYFILDIVGTPSVYCMDFKNINYIHHSLIPTTAKELFGLYFNCCISREETDSQLYWAPSKHENKYRKKLNLKEYGEYNHIGINPHRLYESKIIEDKGIIIPHNYNELSYSVRRVLFEFVLYYILENRVVLGGWTKGSLEELYSGDKYFCKYSEGGLSLIMFKEWFT